MFSNLCAKCHQGQIFKHFFFMNEDCPHCGHHFEREEGYFIGSIIISYFAATMLALPVLLLEVFKYEVEFIPALVIACAFMTVIFPFIYRYSKLAWIQIEEQLYQSFQKKRDEGKRAEERARLNKTGS